MPLTCSERRQLTRLQAYIVASAFWPRFSHPLLRRQRARPPVSTDQGIREHGHKRTARQPD
jgi:hypothetical protein